MLDTMESQRTLGSILRELREKRGLSQKELARLSGVSRSFINLIEAGRRPSISMSMARSLAAALDVSPSVFFGDMAGMQRPLDSIIRELNAIQPRAIPVLDQLASAGEGVLAQDYVYLSREKAAGDNIVAIVAKGDCLVPEVHAGDTLILDLDASAEDGDLVVATRDHDVIVKRFRQAGDDQWLEANDTKIPIADVDLKGVVIGLYRSKR